jgi:hypothetical protein
MNDLELVYPVGKLQRQERLDPDRRREMIAEIRDLPAQLREALSGISTEQWNYPYRPGGWTIRQVVHHLADSHINAYVRFRLALTEETPTIKPYDEALWATLPDVAATPPDFSLQILEGLHRRLVDMLERIDDSAFSRQINHPEHQRRMSIDELLGTYSWHGRHHLAHIRNALARGRSFLTAEPQ